MPGFLPREDRQRGGNAIERAAQVDVDHRVPVIDAQRIEARDRADAGVVDDNVEPAAMFERERDERFEIGAHTDIGAPVRHFAPGRRDLARDIRQQVFAPRAEHDRCARLCQQQGRRAADAAAAPGNRDHFACNAHTCLLRRAV